MGRRKNGGLEKDGASELQAKSLLERELQSDLQKVQPKYEQRRNSPDYRSADGSHAVEVKEVTSQSYRQLAKIQLNPSYDSSLLTGRWHLMIMMPTNSTVMEPTPDFPSDNHYLDKAARSDLGAGIVPKSQREEEWKRSHPWSKKVPAQPRIKNLARDLERPLSVLEEHGIFSTRGPWPETPEAIHALLYVNGRTNNSLCIRHETTENEDAGIDITFAAGYTRTGVADTLVERIELWLSHEEYGKNVLDSLAGEENAEKHAVLVFDRHTEPEYMSAEEQGVNFCPTGGIDLPEEIDVLWFIIGSTACRYNRSDGWSSIQMP